MTFSKLVAQHFKEVYFGGNWTGVGFITQLDNIALSTAIKQHPNGHDIATLAYHIHYFTHSILGVLQGKKLTSKDAESFDRPELSSDIDWLAFKENCANEAKQLVIEIEKLSDEALQEDFVKSDYGSVYRNLHGLIEHCHYHLGQIVLLKKSL